MKMIGKQLTLILIITFLCQNVGFCLPRETFTLRIPVNGSLRVKKALEMAKSYKLPQHIKIGESEEDASETARKLKMAPADEKDFKRSVVRSNEKQLTSLIFALLPDSVRILLLGRIKVLKYPGGFHKYGHGQASPDGKITIAPCGDPLYYAEVLLHEIAHVLDSDLAKYLGVDEDEVHEQTNGLFLYILYPEKFREFAHNDKRWRYTYKFYKKLFKKEYYHEEIQPIFTLIEMDRDELNELKESKNINGVPRKIAKKHRIGYAPLIFDNWTYKGTLAGK
ncbi:MAG: hypothetical protein KKD11_05560, partial [Candidatus Omnitrophica bacterium]|nr:hypothetical protein [Candidatus Omnitrophota bacterium]